VDGKARATVDDVGVIVLAEDIGSDALMPLCDVVVVDDDDVDDGRSAAEEEAEEERQLTRLGKVWVLMEWTSSWLVEEQQEEGWKTDIESDSGRSIASFSKKADFRRLHDSETALLASV
jgi:hypothetical protein